MPPPPSRPSLALSLVCPRCAPGWPAPWLASRQIRHVAQHRAQPSAPFAERITLAAHQKAADYTMAKARFWPALYGLVAAVVLG